MNFQFLTVGYVRQFLHKQVKRFGFLFIYFCKTIHKHQTLDCNFINTINHFIGHQQFSSTKKISNQPIIPRRLEQQKLHSDCQPVPKNHQNFYSPAEQKRLNGEQ